MVTARSNRHGYFFLLPLCLVDLTICKNQVNIWWFPLSIRPDCFVLIVTFTQPVSIRPSTLICSALFFPQTMHLLQEHLPLLLACGFLLPHVYLLALVASTASQVHNHEKGEHLKCSLSTFFCSCTLSVVCSTLFLLAAPTPYVPHSLVTRSRSRLQNSSTPHKLAK